MRSVSQRSLLRAISLLSLCCLASGLAACGDDTEAEGCDPCEPGSEYCVRYASDIEGDDDVFGCEPLPDSCGNAPACDCLEGEIDDGLTSCLEEGGCDVRGETLVVLCPGG